MSVIDRLRSLKHPIRVGVIGVGAMGKGVVHQIGRTPGMRCVAVADLNVPKGLSAICSLGMDAREVSDVSVMCDTIERGQVAVAQDGMLVAICPQVDLLVEASTSVVPACEFVLAALERSAPVVLMNSEADLTFGPLFQDAAMKHGAGCSSIDGDQYTVLSRMIREVEFWGMSVVMAGNIKGFLDRTATAEGIRPEAEKRNLDPVTCAAMADGTKLNIEMALLCNTHDLYADVPGMHGPVCADVRQVPEVFDLPTMWEPQMEDGVPTSRGTVDYILGAEPGGGVFLVAYEGDAYQREMLRYYKCGDGPYYLFYRPWHICHIEAMRAVAELAIDGEPVMTPKLGHRAEVWAYAKRPLRAGEILDEIGGETCYGMIHNSVAPWREEGLPVGIMHGTVLKRAASANEPIMVPDVDTGNARLAFGYYEQSRGCHICGA